MVWSASVKPSQPKVAQDSLSGGRIARRQGVDRFGEQRLAEPFVTLGASHNGLGQVASECDLLSRLSWEVDVGGDIQAEHHEQRHPNFLPSRCWEAADPRAQFPDRNTPNPLRLECRRNLQPFVGVEHYFPRQSADVC
jgi:hypothetical protein